MNFADIFHALSTNEGQVQFLGAFFASLFSLLTLGLVAACSALFKRKNKHYNGLVRLELEFNRHIARMHDVVYVLNGTITTHKERHISFNNMAASVVSPIADYEFLLDINMINKLFSYDRGLEKLNDDLVNIGTSYAEVRSVLVSGQMKLSEFLNIFPGLEEDLSILSNAWEMQIKEAVGLAAEVRLMIQRDRTLIIRVKNWLVKRGMKPIGAKELRRERQKVMTEIRETQDKSSKEIEKLLTAKEKRHSV